MARMRSLASLISLLVSGCIPEVIEADAAGDEQGETSSSGESSTSSDESSTSDEASTSSEASSTSDDPSTTSGETTTETTSGETTTETTTETGGQLHNCGWLPEKEYYFCDSLGEPDPSMTHPMDCAAFDFPPVEGAPCGAELNYIGCCDENGDAWYCYMGFIEYEVCGAL